MNSHTHIFLFLISAASTSIKHAVRKRGHRIRVTPIGVTGAAYCAITNICRHAQMSPHSQPSPGTTVTSAKTVCVGG